MQWTHGISWNNDGTIIRPKWTVVHCRTVQFMARRQTTERQTARSTVVPSMPWTIHDGPLRSDYWARLPYRNKTCISVLLIQWIQNYRQSMWAERSGRFCRSALNLIFLTSAHRSVPAPRPPAHAPPNFFETRSPLRSAPPEFWPAPLRFRSAHTCHKLSRKQWPISSPTGCIVL